MRMRRGGRPPPPTGQTATTSSSSWPPSSSPLVRHLLSSLPATRPEPKRLAPGPAERYCVVLAGPTASRERIMSCRTHSVPHRLAAEVRRLLSPAALVVVEIRVELGQRHDQHASLLDWGGKNACVVRR